MITRLYVLAVLMWLSRPRPEDGITAAARRRIKSRWRWPRRRDRPGPAYRPRHRKCPAPAVLKISAREIGMAATLIPREPVSWRCDATMPIPVFRDERVRGYLARPYPRST
jgi:hypothetical protein